MAISCGTAKSIQRIFIYYVKKIGAWRSKPRNQVCHSYLGILYNILSDYQSGAEALEHSIKMNKHNTYAYLALGDALERQKDIQKAINVYKELLQ